MEKILESGMIPDDVNFVMGTYSQFNRAPDKSDKVAWLYSAVRPGVRLFMDESHNAASSTSATAKNIAKAVDQADSVTYASATWAKGAKTMMTYKPVFPASVDMELMEKVRRRGGAVFDEIYSSMLVEDGVLRRLEMDFSQAEFKTVTDTTHEERNRAVMRAVAPVLEAMAYVSGDVDQILSRFNEEQAGLLDRARDEGRRNIRSMQMTTNSFGSPLSLFSRLLLTSMKVDKSIDLALEAIENNEKPVFVVENTVEGMLRELKESLENENDPEGAIDEIEGAALPDMRMLLNRILNRITTVRKRHKDETTGEVEIEIIDMAAESEEVAEVKARIGEMIEGLPNLTVSPIDKIITTLEENGHTVGEISGRNLCWRDGRIERRPR